MGINSADPRVSSWQLSGLEKPSDIAAEVVRRVGPYFWESYEPGHPHQLRRFRPRKYLSDYAMEIASVEWALCYLAVASFSGSSDIRVQSNVHVVWDRTLWSYNDWLELEDIDTFSTTLKSALGAFELHSRGALFFEDRAKQLQVAIEALLRVVHLPKNFALPTIQADQRRPQMEDFLSLRVHTTTGRLIDKSKSESEWLKARKLGVTASDANRLIKLSGERRTSWWDVLESKSPDYVPHEFDSYALGIEREPAIAAWVIERFQDEEFIANHWLFADSEEARFLATPDLIGNYAIAEIKVSTKPLEQIISRYRDQLQWQLKVLNCERLLFVVEQRNIESIEAKWIYADAERQSQLENAAFELLEELAEELPDIFN